MKDGQLSSDLIRSCTQPITANIKMEHCVRVLIAWTRGIRPVTYNPSVNSIPSRRAPA
jgi:hypothetical protein